jgi:sulfur dioxygenase
MGEQTHADVVSMRVAEGDRIEIEGLRLGVLYTPGHTDDSYSFVLADRVFTGDTLLIRGTGRTDFQNGDPRAQYDSIFNKLLKLPDETLVYPAHGYKGETVTTIGEEKCFNPRLRVKSVDEYADLMNNLKLPNPKMMNVAVPANMQVGLRQEEIVRKGWALSAAEAMALRGRPDVAIVDLREKGVRDKHGIIPGSLRARYPDLQEHISAGGMLQELTAATGKRIVFYCAFGECSAMAVQAAQDASSDHGSALRIVLWWHTQQHTSSDRTPLARMLPNGIGPQFRSRTISSTAASAVKAVARSQTSSRRRARPGWIRLRKFWANIACWKVLGLIRASVLATAIRFPRGQSSGDPFGFWARFARLGALVTAHNSNASAAAPAKTVAAFHSPLWRALVAVLMSSRMLSRRSISEINCNSAVAWEGA